MERQVARVKRGRTGWYKVLEDGKGRYSVRVEKSGVTIHGFLSKGECLHFIDQRDKDVKRRGGRDVQG